MTNQPTPILDRITANRPIIQAIGRAVVNAARRSDTSMTPENVQTDVAAIAEEITNDPVAQNDLNMEPLSQSRTFLSNIGSILGAVSVIIIGLSTGVIDDNFINSIGILLGLGGTVLFNVWGAISRARSGQKPFGWFGITNLIRKARGLPPQ